MYKIRQLDLRQSETQWIQPDMFCCTLRDQLCLVGPQPTTPLELPSVSMTAKGQGLVIG